jgi:hypothetical protein
VITQGLLCSKLKRPSIVARLAHFLGGGLDGSGTLGLTSPPFRSGVVGGGPLGGRLGGALGLEGGLGRLGTCGRFGSFIAQQLLPSIFLIVLGSRPPPWLRDTSRHANASSASADYPWFSRLPFRSLLLCGFNLAATLSNHPNPPLPAIATGSSIGFILIASKRLTSKFENPRIF